MPLTLPLLVKGPPTLERSARKVSLSALVAAVLLTLMLREATTSPTRTTPKSTFEVTSWPAATLYTLPARVTFCGASAIWQFGAQPPTLDASETKLMVAVPALPPVKLPAVPVFMPTTRLALSVPPGASRLKLPEAVKGAPLLTMPEAVSAAWGGAEAWFVTLTWDVNAAAPTRTAPRLMTGVLITGLAWLMTLPAAVMTPCTP